jgi:hypothetical protein
VTTKLASIINRLIVRDLAAGRVVSDEKTALSAVRRARCQADLELAQALASQALAERIEALEVLEREHGVSCLGEDT